VTYGQGWTPPPPPPFPPPPPPPTRRYAGKWIWLGVPVGIVVTIGLPALGVLLGSRVEAPEVRSYAFFVGLMVPLGLGITITSISETPARRGFGLGLIIGWGLAPIVFAGICTVILIGAYAEQGLAG